MNQIVMLLPREEMVRQMQELAQKEHFELEVRCASTENIVEEAVRAVAEGACVLVARGLQAQRISENLNVPVVNIRMTAQELGLLILKAKRLTPALRPRIALVAPENMLCDTSCFDILFGIELQRFHYDSNEDYEQANNRAVSWGADVIIGGDNAVRAAQKAGICGLFLDSIEDSLREAMRSAQTVLYAGEHEKRINAQFDALMSNTSNGYLQLDAMGRAVKTNDIMTELLERKRKDVLGCTLAELVPGIEREALQNVLNGGSGYSTFLHLRYQAVVAILAPIRFEDGRVEGAVLTCHKVRRNIQVDSNGGFGEGITSSNLSDRKFENLHQKSALMQRVVHNARLFSQSGSPVLITGERGLDRNLLAQCIHNNSLYRNGPFVALNCSGLPPEKQLDMLFGTGEKDANGELDLGAFGTANNGTLYLLELDKLAMSTQYNVYRALRYRRITQNRCERAVHIDVRLIATSQVNLRAAMEKGEFREDLYYLLSGLELQVPPLRERPEDLADMLEEIFKDCCDTYHRYHVLTNGAVERLRGYPWYGNGLQIRSFIERLVITARQRSIDEVIVQDLWDELYPTLQNHGNVERMVVYKSPEALRLTEMLERHGGNRALTAQELGISTTTLWRKMKKLGISGHFGNE